jgi:mannose-1-phosphate guanylyltransferase
MLIAIVGMSDVVVIDSEQALLVCKRGDTDNIKELIDFMRRKHINRY